MHTTFGDGKHTPEEMVKEAILRGFDSVGFSEHSYNKYSKILKNAPKTEDYKAEILRLKEKYKDIIKIHLGLEVETVTGADKTGYDYIIGAVHWLDIDGQILPMDGSLEHLETLINDYFDGDGLKFSEKYYDTVATIENVDILGHFDLVTKYIEKYPFIDITSKAYLDKAIETLEKLSGKIPYFEVNTGAISRGVRTIPYPHPLLMKEIKRLGFKPVITSDAHNKDHIDFAFDMARELLLSSGFREKYVLTDNGFIPCEI